MSTDRNVIVESRDHANAQWQLLYPSRGEYAATEKKNPKASQCAMLIKQYGRRASGTCQAGLV